VVELRAVATNLVLLCESCHDFIHSNANKNREFIREASGRV
jgi:predicted HNH restriction endonuclease